MKCSCKHLNILPILIYSFLLLGGTIRIYAQTSFQEHYQTAKKANDTLSMVRALRSWADSLSIEGNLLQSDSIFTKAVQLTEQQNDLYRTGILYNDLATNASYAGKSEKALHYYNKALDAFTQIKNADKIAMILVNIGSEYRDAGNIELAIEYKLKALEKKRDSGTIKNLDYYYQSVGELFKETDVEKWSYYVKKAYEVTQILPQSRFQTKAMIFNDLAGISSAKNENTKALAWYDSLMLISQKNNYYEGIAKAHSNRSVLFLKEKNYPKSFAEIQKAIKIDDKTKRVHSQMAARIKAANIAKEMKNYTQATRYAREALNLAQHHHYPTEEIDAHLALAKIGKQTHNWKMAYKHFEAYKLGADSLLNAKVKESLHNMELKYQTAEKNRTIEKLDTENKIKNIQLNRNKMLIIMLVISSLLVIFVLLFITTRRRLKQQKRQEELKQKLLRTQLNPHFMYNALAAIQAYMLDHKNTDSIKYLLNFSQLMRNILDSSRAEEITLAQEEAIITDYLCLQQLRFNHQFNFTISVAENIDKEQITLPPMLLQPFIENAVEHGIKSLTKEEKGIIKVEIKQNAERQLLITVSDNGKGLKHTSNLSKKHLSHSTQITQERIKALNSLSKYRITLLTNSNKETGTKVLLKICAL